MSWFKQVPKPPHDLTAADHTTQSASVLTMDALREAEAKMARMMNESFLAEEKPSKPETDMERAIREAVAMVK